MIGDKHGQKLTNKEEIKERWVEHIEECHVKEDKPEDIELQEPLSLDDLGPDLLTQEILQTVKELKNGKARGVDGIPAEIIKALETFIIQVYGQKISSHHL